MYSRYTDSDDVKKPSLFKVGAAIAGVAASIFLLNRNKIGIFEAALADEMPMINKKLFGSAESHIIQLLHGATAGAKAVSSHLGNLGTQITTTVMREERKEFFYKALSTIMKDPSKLADASFGSRIDATAHEILKAAGSSEALGKLKDSVFRRLLNTIGEDNLILGKNMGANIDKLSEQLATFPVNRQKKDILKIFFGNTINLDNTIDSFGNIVSESNEVTLRSIKNGTTGGSTPITFGDILDNKNGVADKLNDYFIGVNGGLKQDPMDLQLNNELADSFNKLIGHNPDNPQDMLSFPQAQFDKYLDIARKAQSGYILNDKGVVVAYSAIDRTIKSGLSSAFDGLQIPLLPGVMDVPLNIFNFLKRDNNAIDNIGSLFNQIELRKAGQIADSDLGKDGIVYFGNLYSANKEGITHLDKVKFNAVDLSNGKTRQIIEARIRDAQAIPNEINNDTIKEYFMGDDKSRVPEVMKLMNQKPGLFFDINYTPEGSFRLAPKNDTVALILKHLETNFDYSVNSIHPEQLLDFLQQGNQHLTNRDMFTALEHVMFSASHVKEDLGIKINVFAKNGMSEWLLAGDPSSPLGKSNGLLFDLISATSDEEKIAAAKALVGEESSFYNYSTELYRAAERIAGSEDPFGRKVGKSAQGLLGGLKEGLIGVSEFSHAEAELQKGILTEVVRRSSLNTALQDVGISGLDELADLGLGVVQRFKRGDTTKAYQLFSSDKRLVDFFQNVGFMSPEASVKALVDASSVVFDTANKSESLRIRLRDISVLTTPKYDLGNRFLNATGSSELQARATSVILNDLTSTGRTSKFEEENLLELIKSSTGRGYNFKGFTPHESNHDVSSAMSHILLPSGNDYGRSLFDVNSPLNYGTYAATSIMQGANSVLTSMGLGLRSSDKRTAAQAMGGFVMGRVLPFVAAYYAYNQVNAELDAAGLPTIPEMGANITGHAVKLKTRLQDATGVTNFMKRLVDTVPGLDQYMNPRDSKEYEQYMKYGYDTVRSRRNWIFGNRGQITGGSVETFTPSWYRRWSSNWQMADNTKYFNSVTSSAFWGNWADEVEDRPYSAGKSLEMLRQRNPSGGGGMPQMGIQGQGMGASSGYGMGQPGVQGLESQLRMAANFNGNHLSDTKGDFSVGSVFDRLKSVSGFFGAFYRYIPFYPDSPIKLQTQDPDYARSFGKLIYGGRHGEFTGPFGEFFRRFVPQKMQDYEAVNPLVNNFTGSSWLPQWMVGKGDPYERMPNGAQLLPGDAYFKLNPYVTYDHKKKGFDRYESLDSLSKFEILARIAPNTTEYINALTGLQGSQFTEDGYYRYQQALGQAEEKRNGYKIYNKRNTKTSDGTAKVTAITSDGVIATDKGSFRFANISFTYTAQQEGIAQVLKIYGIYPGSNITVRVVEGTLALASQAVVPAIINGANSRIVSDGYATYNRKDTSPLGYNEMYGQGLGGKVVEKLLHSDNVVSNKFFRVRTPNEQMSRGEVYGTDSFDWRSPFHTLIAPSIRSFAHKNPIAGGIGAGIGASFFFSSRKGKAMAFAIASVSTAGLSIVEKMRGGLPRQYVKDTNVDEYLDAVKYVKHNRIIMEVDRTLRDRFHTTSADIENPNEDVQALIKVREHSETIRMRTMVAYDTVNASLSKALKAIPSRHKQLAEEVIINGDQKEKDKFYEMLPSSERAILGVFLNQKNIPDKLSIEEIAKKYAMPDPNWKGWDALTDDKYTETLVRANQDVLAGRPGTGAVEKARNMVGPGFGVPNPKGHTTAAQLHGIMSAYPELGYTVSMVKSANNSIHVNFDTQEDLRDYYRQSEAQEIGLSKDPYNE